MSIAEPAARPHPRIRERRVAVRREAGRRRLRLLVGLLVIIGSIASGWGATRTSVFDVDRIAVHGADRTTGDVVATAGGLEEGRAMIDIDTAAAAAAIERLPWVRTAAVTRRWPGSVTVTIAERVPVALVELADGWVLADATGRVLAKASPETAVGAPLVHVTAADEQASPPGSVLAPGANAAIAFAARAAALLPDRIRSVTAGEQGIEVRLDDRTAVVVGPLTDLDAKLTALVTLLDRVDLRGVRTIDLRVPGAPVLTRG